MNAAPYSPRSALPLPRSSPPPDHNQRHELPDGGTFGYVSTLGEPHVSFKTRLENPPKLRHEPQNQDSGQKEQIRGDPGILITPRTVWIHGGPGSGQAVLTYLPNTNQHHGQEMHVEQESTNNRNLTTQGTKIRKASAFIDGIPERKRIPSLLAPNRPPPHPAPGEQDLKMGDAYKC